MDEQEMTEENCRDYEADMAYDRMCEDAISELADDMRVLYEKYVHAKMGYYRNHAERFKEHAVSLLDSAIKYVEGNKNEKSQRA